MKIFNTEQENFWAGEFGRDYINRNKGAEFLASNINFFSKALSNINTPNSCIEFGANIGMNLKALKILFPEIEQYAIEINKTAIDSLEKVIPKNNIIHDSILNFQNTEKYDLCLIKGVLIHINPDSLPLVYKSLVESTKNYLLIAEYYNPTPISIDYRGHQEKLFKRDFAGEIMDLFPEMKLFNYGFAYHRDKNFPQDDISWFLLKKN